MDIISPTNTPTPNVITPTIGGLPPSKRPEIDSKPTGFTNGVLKRHKNHHQLVVGGACGMTYKECLKNHAASLGGHALDGCGEFMPAQTATATDPTSLKCAACGCHRNFHRMERSGGAAVAVGQVHHQLIEYQPLNRHHPLPPPSADQQKALAACEAGSPGSDDDDDQSPPPISSTYHPGSAPHMLLALNSGPTTTTTTTTNTTPNGNHVNMILTSSAPPNIIPSRKRFRTKFTQEQKDKMHEFAEKMGWKMQKSNEELVKGLCNEIGVQREVFKVWMHNNKNTLGRRSGDTNYMISGINPNTNHLKEEQNGNGNSHSSSINNSHNSINHHQQQPPLFNCNAAATNNASSSSS